MVQNKVKLIAADMDGTLLNSKGVLDQSFFSIFKQLKKNGITFVAASGRQYYNLLKLFDDIKDDIYFIAENGTYVVHRSQELLVMDISIDDVREVVREVRAIDGAYPVLCGKDRAYIEDRNPEFVKQAYTYYERCDIVDDLLAVTDDKFLKVAIYDFNDASTNSYPFLKHFDATLKVVVSGKNWVDISHQQANKGHALQMVQEILSVTPDDSIAFGDQMNDAEMLQAVYHSYAMQNSVSDLKTVARYIAPSNDDNGVITVIGQMLDAIRVI